MSFLARRRHVTVLLGLLLAGPRAVAGPPPRPAVGDETADGASLAPTPAERLARARAHYDDLEYHKAATELVPVALDVDAPAEARLTALELLGICALALGDEELAGQYFEALLALDPGHRLREESGSPKVIDLFEQVKRRSAGRSGGARDTGPGARGPASPRARGAARRPGHGWKVSGVVTGVGGLLLAGTGASFALRASAIEREVEDAVLRHDAWDPALGARDADGRRAALLADLALGAGAVAVVAGVVLYVHGARAAAEGPAPTVTPVVDGERLGLVVSGRF